MMNLCCDVLRALEGKMLVTAESCTGGGIGSALTSVPGSSSVYRGGVICYSNWVKESVLGVDHDALERYGAVSEVVAGQMASGVKQLMKADVAVSVTGLAGPGGDDHGHEVGAVFIGCQYGQNLVIKEFHFAGDRDAVRRQAVEAALYLIIDMVGKEKE